MSNEGSLGRVLAGAVVAVLFVVGLVAECLPDKNDAVPDHWTHDLEGTTWHNINKGTAGGRFERSCVLDVIETAYPDPRDFRRAEERKGSELDNLGRQIVYQCS